MRNAYLSNAAYAGAVSLIVHRNTEFYNPFNREPEKKSRAEAYAAVAKRLPFHVYSITKKRENLTGRGNRE